MSWPKGKPKSDETRAKMRAAKLGKPLAVEHRAEIGPPVLLPTVAVGAGRLPGVELEHGDELAVVRDAGGDPDPPYGSRRQVPRPALHCLPDAGRVRGVSLDDLAEHGDHSLRITRC